MFASLQSSVERRHFSGSVSPRAEILQ
jgi:hypothetical protein